MLENAHIQLYIIYVCNYIVYTYIHINIVCVNLCILCYITLDILFIFIFYTKALIIVMQFYAWFCILQFRIHIQDHVYKNKGNPVRWVEFMSVKLNSQIESTFEVRTYLLLSNVFLLVLFL